MSLRITEGARQEIKAKFYEDTRGVSTLTIQRYTVENGSPHATYFTFINDEIAILFNFLRNVQFLPLKDAQSAKLDDEFVESLVLSREQALELLNQQPDLLDELVRSRVTARDVAELNLRKDQLREFESLLFDEKHFERRRLETGKGAGPEAVWQQYFEKNTWIFGYGLNYVFNSTLDDRKLEQVVRGHDIGRCWKARRCPPENSWADQCGIVWGNQNHATPLLKQIASPYRKECWQISDELAGAIAQVQRSVQVSLSSIRSRLDVRGDDGAPTGETVFLYQPRSFLVIGSLAEFRTQHGINEEKYSSFELFRKSVTAPEIITFDELFERARFIVEAGEHRDTREDGAVRM